MSPPPLSDSHQPYQSRLWLTSKWGSAEKLLGKVFWLGDGIRIMAIHTSVMGKIPRASFGLTLRSPAPRNLRQTRHPDAALNLP